MHKERFARLIKVIEKTPDERFDMNVWARQTPCGTVGCAAGNYALAYPKCGLRMKYLYGNEALIEDRDGNCGFGAIEAHFGISWSQTIRLFSIASYLDPSRANVLNRLRRFFNARTAAKAARKVRTRNGLAAK